MHILKEVGIIAFRVLVNNLAPYGYHPVKHTPDLWRHRTRRIMSILAANNFVNGYNRYYLLFCML